MKKITSSLYSFEQLRENNFVYVDKTEYIWNLIDSAPAMYFLSRPRRFGKSLTVSTLKAFFEGRKELFEGLAIYDKVREWKKYPVIHLALNGRKFDTLEDLESSLVQILLRQAEILNIALEQTDSVTMFQNLIWKAKEKGPVVILIDEYDKPILDNIISPDVQSFLRAVKSFYSVLKENCGDLHFVFITGVTKFCHVSLFSDLNNLEDITMRAEYATMFGYTQAELEENFGDRIEITAKKQNLSVDELKAQMKVWYDGYCFEENSEKVYNPVSVAKFFENDGKFENYWFATGTPSFLMALVKQRDLNFEDAVSKPVPGVAFNAFEIDDIDPVTLLLQTGYLTIKSVERRFNRPYYRLDFPNEEVAEAFTTYLLNSYVRKTQREVASFATDLSIAFVDNDLKQAQKILESFFAGIPYPVHKKSEATFQTIFYAVFRLLGFNIEAESWTNDGRIDAVVQTEKHIYLFEFKLDDDKSALSQIKEKEYFKKFLQSKKPITMIGVTFDSNKGQISDWKAEDLPM